MSVADAVDRLFGGKKKEGSPVDASSSGVGASKGAPDLAALRQAVGKTRNRTSKVEVAQQEAAQKALLEQLFDNENWEELAKLPFDIRYALTGFEYFRLDERQTRILGRSMGTCMQMLLQIDPRWVALIVFSTNMGVFWTDKELAYRQYLKQQQAKRTEAVNGAR